MVDGAPRVWGRRRVLLAGLGALGPAVLAGSPAAAESSAAAQAALAARPANREVIFYAPHPDDETLSMCVLIANHVLVGRKVHVVLLTDGRTSAALAAVNARLAAEGLAPLTLAQFGAARVREFRAACARLGVAAANVHVANITGLLTVANTTPVFRAYQARYPDAGHYTLTWTDPFGDHGSPGEALRRLHRTDPVAFFDTRWVVYRIHWREKVVLALKPWWARPTPVIKARVVAAIAEYSVWKPAAGRYRIGFYSVVDQFLALKADVRNLLHGP